MCVCMFISHREYLKTKAEIDEMIQKQEKLRERRNVSVCITVSVCTCVLLFQ